MNTGKHFCTVTLVDEWHGLLRETVEATSLGAVKTHLDMELDNLLRLILLGVGLGNLQSSLPTSNVL